MSGLEVSVIIPTRNRPEKLVETLACLIQQDLEAVNYEIVVVDDGSDPTIVLADVAEGPRCEIVRLEGAERSAARNAGAAVAKGRILVFVDDDMTVHADFLASHLNAHHEWASALVVGAVSLPDHVLGAPFGRFRQGLEQQIVPHSRGVTTIPNLCTAANMSISKALFQNLGGFDPLIRSSEDQDLALQHSANGGKIVFIPEARAIHNDSTLDVRGYCRRAEWGTEHAFAFQQRYADWWDNIERERVNGGVRWGREPVSLSLRKLIKAALAFAPCREALFLITTILERVAPASGALDKMYRVLLGIHIFRGYRQGLACYADDANH
jgi:glycosyltransferase involved in cell wall biosynthesis